MLRGLGNGSAPGMVGLRNRLAEIQGWIHTTLVARGEDDIPEAEEEEEGEEDYPPAGPHGHHAPPPAGPIASREDAYYWIAAAADYLLRTEPHSPTPYLLQRAIMWGGMPLHEILIEISRGRNDLSAVIDFLGFNVSDVPKNTGRG